MLALVWNNLLYPLIFISHTDHVENQWSMWNNKVEAFAILSTSAYKLTVLIFKK